MESLIVAIRVERRWPLWAALVVALGWLLAAVAALAAAQSVSLPALALALLPPLALLLLVTALLPAARAAVPLDTADLQLADTLEQVSTLAASLAAVNGSLAACVAQTAVLATATASTLPGLGGSGAMISATAADIAASGAATQSVVAGFGASLPALAETLAAIETTLQRATAGSADQLQHVAAALSDVEARQHSATAQAEASIAAMMALVARIDEASQASTSAIAKRAYALDSAVDGVLARSSAVVEQISVAVEARLQGLADGVDAAHRQLMIQRDDGAVDFAARLDALLATSGLLSDRLANHAGAADHIQDRLAAAGDAGEALTDRLSRLDTRATDLSSPLGEADAALARLAADIDVVFARAETVGEAVQRGADAASAATRHLADNEAAITASATLMIDRLHTARAVLTDMTADTSAAHAEVARIEPVATKAAAVLATVLSSAVTALLTQMDTAMASLNAESAGMAARLSDQLQGVTDRVDAGTARLEAIDARFAVRERDAIGARAARVIERLHEASIDVARLLEIRLGESDWAAHRAGDRSVFARAIVPQLGDETDRKMARLYAHDPAFRNEAGFFCDNFEGMIIRLANGRDGHAIATSMLTSDIGKIYLALAAASNRNAPSG